MDDLVSNITKEKYASLSNDEKTKLKNDINKYYENELYWLKISQRPKFKQFNFWLFDTINEGCAIGRYKSIEDVDIKEVCGKVVRNWFDFTKQEMAELVPEFCKWALKIFWYERCNEKAQNDLYYLRVGQALDIYCDWSADADEYGIHKNASPKLKDYCVELKNTFDEVASTTAEREFVEYIPRRQSRTIEEYQLRSRTKRLITDIISGKVHKGHRLSGIIFYPYKGEERELIRQPLFKHYKNFLRLCYYKSDDEIYLAIDDTANLDFRLAVLSMIEFDDQRNKQVFHNKMEQYRHNQVAAAVESRLLDEINKKYGI
ncbi:MAG: hypothetical protein FWC80_05135 [Firmicutes bacterium]|nr:hypothetical protein [Bacillota bacterium]